MGQRLPGLSQDWANLAARGYDKYADAGRIAGEGQAALGQGIAHGIAQITTGILRKKSEAREDSIRKETWAHSDAVRADENARQDRFRMEDRQQRRDDLMDRSLDATILKAQAEYDAGDLSAKTRYDEAVSAKAALLSRRISGIQENPQGVSKAASATFPDFETWKQIKESKGQCPT